MNCPKCGSENVSISLETVGEKTKKAGIGLAGHAQNTGRKLAAMCTLGMSNLVIKKATGTEKTTAIQKKICLCQDCGESWELK